VLDDLHFFHPLNNNNKQMNQVTKQVAALEVNESSPVSLQVEISCVQGTRLQMCTIKQTPAEVNVQRADSQICLKISGKFSLDCRCVHLHNDEQSSLWMIRIYVGDQQGKLLHATYGVGMHNQDDIFTLSFVITENIQ
jgi:hypothetical protein